MEIDGQPHGPAALHPGNSNLDSLNRRLVVTQSCLETVGKRRIPPVSKREALQTSPQLFALVTTVVVILMQVIFTIVPFRLHVHILSGFATRSSKKSFPSDKGLFTSIQPDTYNSRKVFACCIATDKTQTSPHFLRPQQLYWFYTHLLRILFCYFLAIKTCSFVHINVTRRIMRMLCLIQVPATLCSVVFLG